MAELSTVTIGLTLLGFILGAVIVALANQSRMKRLEEAHGAQIRRMRDDEAKRSALLEDTHEALLRAESETRDVQRETEMTRQEIEILRAQQGEELEAAAGLEDRLNAAEARLLTLEATSTEQEDELLRWNRAYGALKGAHAQLMTEHGAATNRGLQLEGDLVARRQELDALHSRLDSLQNALSVAIQSGASGELLPAPAGNIPAGVEAIALAKAEVQALLRQREVELSDLRSRLSATRFSVNVLAHSGAELSALLNQSEEERSADALEAAFLRAGHLYLPEVSLDAGAESLASLEGIIGDWYREVRPLLPWSSALLSRFGGEAVAARFAKSRQAAHADGTRDLDESEWSLGEWQAGESDSETAAPVIALPPLDNLPPELMLATVKAATTSALQRTLKRQYELENDAARAQGELAQAKESSEAWRVLVTQLAAEDADVAGLFSEDGGLPESEAVISLLRARLGRTSQGDGSQGTVSENVPAASVQQSAGYSAPQAQSPSQDRGAARRTLIGWLRRIDQAVQRPPRGNQ